MITDAENLIDYASSFYYLFSLISILLMITPTPLMATSSPTTTSTIQNQFKIYRLHQLEMSYGKFGTLSSTFNLEIITSKYFRNNAKNNNLKFQRKCLLLKLDELLIDKKFNELFLEKILNESLISGLLIIIQKFSFFNNFNNNEQKLILWQNIEKYFLMNSTMIPVYFIEENSIINKLYNDYNVNDLTINNQNNQKSIIKLLNEKLFHDTYQFVVNGPSPSSISLSNQMITNFQIKFIGNGIEDQLPTYLIVTHYDSYSIIPSLSLTNSDLNQSGLIIFMELIRIISQLYSNDKTKPMVNIIFLLNGGGKLNYYGTKKWLEKNLQQEMKKDSDDDDDDLSSILENIKFALCLDTLINSDELFMYVSKPPKSGTSASMFLNNLKSNNDMVNITMVHKKINLADDYIYWEHERFSLKRIPSFTLTTLSTSNIIKRRTMVDSINQNDRMKKLEIFIKIISETLLYQIYNLNNLNNQIDHNLLSTNDYQNQNYIKYLSKLFNKTLRQQNFLFTKLNNNGNDYELPKLLKLLLIMMKKYSNNNVRIINNRIINTNGDMKRKKPEFTFYEPNEAQLFIYKTKSAIFDLFITMSIAIYLFAFFLLIKYYDHLISSLRLFKSTANYQLINEKIHTS